MAPPVSRDGFFHSGNSFYVEIHPGRHRHPRCDPTSLYRLLTWTDPGPVLTKAGKVAKRQPGPHKDSPKHFYEAQCVHYGLKQYKTREAAKKHLFAAFDPVTKMLVVPPLILEVEKALEEEYRIANEAEEEKYKEEKRRNEEHVVQERKKKAEENDTMLKEFEAVGIVISKGEVSDINRSGRSNATTNWIPDAQLRDELDALPEAQFRAIINTVLFNSWVKKMIVRQVIALKEQAVKASAASAVVQTKNKGKGNGLKLLSDTNDDYGEYIITAPYLRQEWGNPTDRMSLRMSVSPGGSHLWASFDFGIYSGIMRSQSGPPKFVGNTVQLHWKGRESGEGETSFNKDNMVSITFCGDGRIRGKMCAPATGTFEFIGKKGHKSNIVWAKSVDSWKDEYRGINKRPYEAVNRAKWGSGWYDPGDGREHTPNSDTDPDEAGLYGSEEDDDESDDDY